MGDVQIIIRSGAAMSHLENSAAELYDALARCQRITVSGRTIANASFIFGKQPADASQYQPPQSTQIEVSWDWHAAAY